MKLADQEHRDEQRADKFVSYEEAQGAAKILIQTAMPSRWDLASLAALLKALRGVRELIGQVEDIITERIDKLWPNELGAANKSIDLAGLGRVTRHRGSRRKAWDKDRLYAVVVARAQDERAVGVDGEALESEAACVARVLKDCFRPEPRVTELQRRGINPDEYSEWADGKLNIEVT